MGITSFASSSVREISIGLVGESEMCSLYTLGEAPEDQGFCVHEVKWPMAAAWNGCHGTGVYPWNFLGKICSSGEPQESELM